MHSSMYSRGSSACQAGDSPFERAGLWVGRTLESYRMETLDSLREENQGAQRVVLQSMVPRRTVGDWAEAFLWRQILSMQSYWAPESATCR